MLTRKPRKCNREIKPLGGTLTICIIMQNEVIFVGVFLESH